MIDLKPYYDAARAADDEVQRIMAEMNEHFTVGTDEGKQAALDLRPALDEAKVKAEDANRLYLSLRDAAAQSSNVAQVFVPVTEEAAQAAAEPKRAMKRQDFLALDAAERMAFVRNGGAVLENEEE